ncbi:MAG: DoxX family protein [Polyangiaceae bacterium]
MKYIPTVTRVLQGLVFFVFGLNFFLHFIPQPQNIPPAAASFAGALFASGYFFVLLKVIEVASGVALLANRFVPLALTVLAPIVVNIFAFHLFLEPAGLPLAIPIVILEIANAWFYRDAFRSVVVLRATPSLPKSDAHDVREHAHA